MTYCYTFGPGSNIFRGSANIDSDVYLTFVRID